MLFMNISRKFGAVYQEEANGDAGSPAAVAPTGEQPAAQPAEVAEVPAVVPAKVDDPAAVDIKGEITAFMAEHNEENPAVCLAMNFLGDAGIGINDPAFLQAREGDFTLLKAMLAQKGLAGSDQMVAILEGAVQASIDEQIAFEEKTTATVTEIPGPDAPRRPGWKGRVSTHSKKTTTTINDMLQPGGLQAREVRNSSFTMQEQSETLLNRAKQLHYRWSRTQAASS
ncbi:capsid and scaffold protein [Pectobacterium phage MA14]|nr:capsid and scaffold protein [Pectobacterium phage MA14]